MKDHDLRLEYSALPVDISRKSSIAHIPSKMGWVVGHCLTEIVQNAAPLAPKRRARDQYDSAELR
jgi:hypothetical protein